MAGVIHKIKDAVHTHKDHSDADGTRNPSHSRVADMANPRAEGERSNPRTIGNTKSSENYMNSSSATPDFDDRSAPTTAGPLRSEVMNKADVRTDGERDGARGMGIHSSGKAGGVDADTPFSVEGAKNPRDAAQVPPSVLRRHVGEVSIEHGDDAHQRERRNSTTSHQDRLSGI